MMKHDDFAYYRQRTAVEAHRAARQINPVAAAVHCNLAECYLAILRAYVGQLREEYSHGVNLVPLYADKQRRDDAH